MFLHTARIGSTCDVKGQSQRAQYTTVATSSKALEEQITTYGEELEGIEVFKYFGRFMAYDVKEVRAVKANLGKAQKCWSRVTKVLRSKNNPL